MAKIAMPTLKSALGKTSSSPSQKNQQEQIEKLAYQFYLDRGCENGHDAEDWLRAESIIKSKKK